MDSSCFWYAGDIGVAVARQGNLLYVLVLAHWSRYPVALYSVTNTAACSKQAGCGGREHVVLPRRLVRLGGDHKDKKEKKKGTNITRRGDDGMRGDQIPTGLGMGHSEEPTWLG